MIVLKQKVLISPIRRT